MSTSKRLPGLTVQKQPTLSRNTRTFLKKCVHQFFFLCVDQQKQWGIQNLSQNLAALLLPSQIWSIILCMYEEHFLIQALSGTRPERMMKQRSGPFHFLLGCYKHDVAKPHYVAKLANCNVLDSRILVCFLDIDESINIFFKQKQKLIPSRSFRGTQSDTLDSSLCCFDLSTVY